MPDWLDGCAGPAQFGEDGVRESRPGPLRPVTEVAVAQARASHPRLRIDPEEAAALPEVAERARQVPLTGPVRAFRVVEFEAEPPVIRVHAAEAGQHAGEAPGNATAVASASVSGAISLGASSSRPNATRSSSVPLAPEAGDPSSKADKPSGSITAWLR